MNQILKRIFILGAVFVIMFSLAGCKNSKSEGDLKEKGNTPSSEYGYNIKYEEIKNLSDISKVVVKGNTMYFISFASDKDSDKIKLSLQSIDFSSPQDIKTYASYESGIKDTDDYTFIASFYPFDNGITYFKAVKSKNFDTSFSIDLGDIPETDIITEEYIKRLGIDLKAAGLEFRDIKNQTVEQVVQMYKELTSNKSENSESITMTMITVDFEGNETASTDITSQIEDGLNYSAIYTDKENLYLYSAKRSTTYEVVPEGFLTIFHMSSLEAETIPLGYMDIHNITASLTGEIFAAVTNEEQNLVIMKWDKEQKKFMEVKDSSLSIIGAPWIYPADGNCFYYIDENFLRQYDTDNSSDEAVFNFLDCNILFNNIVSVNYIDENNIYIITNEGGFEDRYLGLNKFTKVKSSELEEKTEIILACQNQSPSTKNAIVRFNKLNSDYKIVVEEDADYNDDETSFHNDILSGNGPDLIDLSSLDYSKYKESALFADIYEFIKNDEDFSKKRFNNNILKLFEQNGKLVALPLNYTITSLASAKNILGNTPFTIDKFAEIIESNPDKSMFGILTSQDEILEKLLLYNQDYFIDYENKSCNFTDGNFEKILNIAKTFPTREELDASLSEDDYLEAEEKRVYEGKQIFYELKMNDLNQYQIAKYILKDDVQLSGYPSVNGEQPAVYISSDSFSDLFAININSKYKEKCWEFIKILYEQSGQVMYLNGFPTDLDMLDKLLKDYSTPNIETDADGKQVEIPDTYNYNNQFEAKLYALSEAEADTIRELAGSVSVLTPQDDGKNFANIVREESKAFFEGEKSAADVCGVIQSRINIKINEDS